MNRFHSGALRVMTYNVHGCVGLDFQWSEKRIAEVIRSFDPDIVALQELDLGRRRSGSVDQAGIIADILGFDRFFFPVMRKDEEHYGDAILSRWPIQRKITMQLPSEKAFPFREHRGALWAQIETPLGRVNVVNTHFGLGAAERRDQAKALIGPDWIGGIPETEPVIVMGDFNSLPGSPAYRVLAGALRDASRAHGRGNRPTFPTFLPVFALDYIFVNLACEVRGVSVGAGSAARLASDHFPLLGWIVPHTDTNVTRMKTDLSA